MTRPIGRPASIALAVVLLSSCSSSGPSGGTEPAPTPTAAPSPAPSAETGTAPTPPAAPAVADYRDVIKLYRANMSEEFILAQIQRELPYDLTVEQIVEVRNGGVPERIIQAMLDHRSAPTEPLPSTEPARPAAPDRMTWEGVVRRKSGIVIFGGRWRIGRLDFADRQLRWFDARDSTRNLLIPERSIAEQFRTCLKKSGGNECFEWGVRTTSGDEYVFRDALWEQAVDGKVESIHSFFRERFPNLIDSSRPADEK